jgi:hypothetical protein
MHTAENLAAALELARAGLFVFPARLLRRNFGWEKKPAIKGWRELATTDEVEIRVWWRLHPQAVPGIELGKSRLFVIDPDRHGNGADGLAAYERLLTQIGELQAHPITITPQGQHHYFRQPVDMLGNSPGGLPNGIDARGDGGWAVAPGAIRDDGTAYRTQDGTPTLSVAYATGSIPEVPEPIVKLVLNHHRRSSFEDKTEFKGRPEPEPSGPVDVDSELAGMQPGRVNSTQCRVIGTLLSYGVAYDEIVDQVVGATMAMAADHKECAHWTREAETGFVRKAIGALLSSRCKQETDPTIAPHWVARELVEDWEKIAAQGGRPLIYRQRDRWVVRNMRWAWGTNGGEEEPRAESPGADARARDNGDNAYTDSADSAESADAGPDPGPKANGPEAGIDAALKFLAGAGAWFHGNELPPPEECSFDQLLPLVGVGTLEGQYSTHKTHILVDAAVAYTCTPQSTLAGKLRLRRGGAVIIETEYSSVPLRVACATVHRGVEGEKLPLISLPTVPPMLFRKRVDPRTIKWYRDVLRAAQIYFKERFDLPLAFVGIDPLIDAFGAESENSADEANEAKKAFRDLAHEFGCVVWIDDHMGKDIERGSRGTSAKPAKADFIFTLPEKVEDIAQPRTLTVKKLRNMPDGWGVDFSLVPVEVATADGTLATNLAVVWGDIVAKGQGASNQQGRPPAKQRLALQALKEMIRATAKPGTSLEVWVELEAWYEELLSRTVIEPDDEDRRRAFKRIKDGLLERGQIKICGEKVCVPVP